MQVHVQLFSFLRDCLPADSRRGRATITLPEGGTLSDLLTSLGIDRHLGYPVSEIVGQAGWQVLVSGRFERDMGRRLRDGDEVLMLPFVAGG